MRRARALASLAVCAAAALAVASPARAAVAVLDDTPESLARAFERQPDGSPGLTAADAVYQLRTTPAVLPRYRQLARVQASALRGRSADAMAAVLRTAVAGAGSRRAFVDGIDAGFAGTDGANLARALDALSRTKGIKGAPPQASRRVHLYVSDPGPILTGAAWEGLRAAMARSGGVWLRTTTASATWSADEWMTWPAETARTLAAKGSSASRAHVVIGPGDPALSWRLARTGGACATLVGGVGGRDLGPDMSVFAAEFRRAFGAPGSKGGPSCLPAPSVPGAAAAALDAAAAQGPAGLELPPGAVLTPPLVSGEPAQLSVRVGSDPLGLAAAAGIPPEELWARGAITVQARAPGVVASAAVEGDGSARLLFTPTAPGPVDLVMVVDAAIAAALARAPAGTGVDLAGPLRAGGSDALLPRVIAAPGRWAIALPLYPYGGTVGDPVAEVVPPPA